MGVLNRYSGYNVLFLIQKTRSFSASVSTKLRVGSATNALLNSWNDIEYECIAFPKRSTCVMRAYKIRRVHRLLEDEIRVGLNHQYT